MSRRPDGFTQVFEISRDGFGVYTLKHHALPCLVYSTNTAVISTRKHRVPAFRSMYISLSRYIVPQTLQRIPESFTWYSHQPITMYPEVYRHGDINTTSSKLENQQPLKFLLQKSSNNKEECRTRSDPFSQRLWPPDPTHAQNIEQMQQHHE